MWLIETLFYMGICSSMGLILGIFCKMVYIEYKELERIEQRA